MVTTALWRTAKRGFLRLVLQLAIVAIGEGVQRQPGALRLQGNQVRGEARTAHDVIHARVIDLDIRSFSVELHIRTGVIFLHRAAVFDDVDAYLLDSGRTHDGVHRTRVVTHLSPRALAYRGHAVVADLPASAQHDGAIGGRMWRDKIHGVALAVMTQIVHLADIGLLGYIAALRGEGVLRRIEWDCHHLRMRHGQQRANFFFHHPVIAFAEDVHDDLTLLINKVALGPTLRIVRLPGRSLLISHHRPRQLKAFCRLAHIVYVETDIELAVMHADDIEAVRVVLRIPAFEHGEVADAVDAGVLPEIDEHDLAAVVGDVVRGRRIEPHHARAEIGRRAHGGVNRRQLGGGGSGQSYGQQEYGDCILRTSMPMRRHGNDLSPAQDVCNG